MRKRILTSYSEIILKNNNLQTEKQFNMYHKKYSTIWILACVTILSHACQAPQAEENPTDAAGVRALLKEKKNQANELNKEIDALTAQLQELDPTEIKPVLVQTQKLSASKFENVATFQGTVVAEETAAASSETGGRITSLNVKEGDYVNKGQLIATVNLETIEKQRLEIETSLSLARTVYERQSRLWSQNIGSELQYLEAKNNVERLEQSLVTMNSQINKKNVYAPISGVVDMVLLKQGELATPGYPIVQILDTGDLKVIADLPENFLNSVKKGTNIEMYFPSIDMKIKKPITEVGRKIDPSNRTFAIEMRTNSQGGKLKPNLLAEVNLKDISSEEVIAVPVNVLQQEISGTNFVYIVGKDGSASKRYVKLGDSNGNMIVVTEGLSAGDELVMVGAIGLTEGAALEITTLTEKETSFN